MNYRTTLALVAATALTACDEQGRQSVTAALSALGATDPVGAAAAPPAPLAFAALSAAPPEPTPAPEPPPPPPFECVSIFRVQTCEDGVLYMLDSNMNWILPGRTE